MTTPARTRYSQVGQIPADWQVRTLRQLSRSSGRYGSSAAALPYNPDLPRYIRITDIDRDGGLRDDCLAGIAAGDAGPHLLADGDLLIARSGATAGKSYLYDRRDGRCAHAGYVIRFALRPDLCEPAFVARWLRSAFYQDWLSRTLRQAAQPNINAAELGALPVPVPPLAAQRRIAEILARSDELIARSKQVVSKLEQVKRSLLHELLGRGLRPDGTPHPDRDRCATAIGVLPSGWTVERLGTLLANVDPAMRSGPFGSALLKSELVDDGFPLLGIDNVGVETFVPRYKRFVSRRKFLELRRYAVRPGDVMITIMGTVGRACVVPDRVGRALSSKHIWTLTLDSQRYLPELAALQLNHARWVLDHFRRYEQGGTMSALSSEILRKVLLPVPPLSEQHRIMEVMTAMSTRVRKERAVVDKHRLTRQALLEDLMHGRVRTDDVDAAAGGSPGPGSGR